MKKTRNDVIGSCFPVFTLLLFSLYTKCSSCLLISAGHKFDIYWNLFFRASVIVAIMSSDGIIGSDGTRTSIPVDTLSLKRELTGTGSDIPNAARSG
jgi:hypothetical protein